MSTSEKLAKQIEFIKEIDKLKKICRQTVIDDGSREENDAEHSWHLAVMAMVLLEYANEPGIDICKVIKMVLIHDIVEIDAGDTFIYDAEGNISKADREEQAAHRIFGLLPKEQELEFLGLWQEFEAKNTPEAKFAAVMDRLEPLLLNSVTKGHTWRKFGIKSQAVREKNIHVREGSAEIWRYINELIDECIKQGILEK